MLSSNSKTSSNSSIGSSVVFCEESDPTVGWKIIVDSDVDSEDSDTLSSVSQNTMSNIRNSNFHFSSTETLECSRLETPHHLLSVEIDSSVIKPESGLDSITHDSSIDVEKGMVLNKEEPRIVIITENSDYLIQILRNLTRILSGQDFDQLSHNNSVQYLETLAQQIDTIDTSGLEKFVGKQCITHNLHISSRDNGVPMLCGFLSALDELALLIPSPETLKVLLESSKYSNYLRSEPERTFLPFAAINGLKQKIGHITQYFCLKTSRELQISSAEANVKRLAFSNKLISDLRNYSRYSCPAMKNMRIMIDEMRTDVSRPSNVSEFQIMVNKKLMFSETRISNKSIVTDKTKEEEKCGVEQKMKPKTKRPMIPKLPKMKSLVGCPVTKKENAKCTRISNTDFDTGLRGVIESNGRITNEFNTIHVSPRSNSPILKTIHESIAERTSCSISRIPKLRTFTPSVISRGSTSSVQNSGVKKEKNLEEIRKSWDGVQREIHAIFSASKRNANSS